MDLKKAGSKKQGRCYSKREEAKLLLLFLNNYDPDFCSLLFSGPYFDKQEVIDFTKFSKMTMCRASEADSEK